MPAIKPPPWLTDVDHATFGRWIEGNARRLQRRRRRRGGAAPLASWRNAILEAVIRGGGLDHWTGEGLRWDLLAVFDPRQARREGRPYRRRFALMPAVDQRATAHDPDLVICSLRTQRLRQDLTRDELMAMSWQLLSHQGFLRSLPRSEGWAEVTPAHPEFLQQLSKRMSFHFLRSDHGDG